MNSRIKVSDLRDPEIKQKRERSYESGLVLRVEKSWLQTIQSFGGGIERPSLDFKYQRLKIVKGKDKTRVAPT